MQLLLSTLNYFILLKSKEKFILKNEKDSIPLDPFGFPHWL